MPHKRAKLSARKADRSAKGADLPPSSNDAHMREMPKGAMRIINAAKIQEDFNRRKKERVAEEAIRRKSSKAATKAAPKIGKGESLTDFSRRVETSMASDVRAVVRSTTPKHKKRKDNTTSNRSGASTSESPRGGKRRRSVDESTASDHLPKVPGASLVKSARDWEKASQRKRVGDVAQSPPTLTKAPRGHSVDALRRKSDLRSAMGLFEEDGRRESKARIPEGVKTLVEAKRKLDLANERERAINAYRRAKEAKLNEQLDSK